MGNRCSSLRDQKGKYRKKIEAVQCFETADVASS